MICKHFWEIESTTKAMAKGKCKLCGEEKTFLENANPYVGFRGQMTEYVQLVTEQKKAEIEQYGIID